MLYNACCLLVGLGLGLDLVSGPLVGMHSYVYYFPLSLLLPRRKSTVTIATRTLQTNNHNQSPLFVVAKRTNKSATNLALTTATALSALALIVAKN